MISKKMIEGMLIVLNKIYFKLPVKEAEYALVEACDLPGLDGRFVLKDGEIIFEKEEK